MYILVGILAIEPRNRCKFSTLLQSSYFYVAVVLTHILLVMVGKNSSLPDLAAREATREATLFQPHLHQSL
jgi:hypothetical protein